MDENGENLTNLLQLAPSERFQTLADFYLDERAKKLYIPHTPLGVILVLSTE